MSLTRFIQLCAEVMVDPAIALENPNIVDALRKCDDEEVERILREEF